MIVFNHVNLMKNSHFLKKSCSFLQLSDYVRCLFAAISIFFAHQMGINLGVNTVKISSFLTDASPKITDLFKDVTKCRFSQAQDNKGESCQSLS